MRAIALMKSVFCMIGLIAAPAAFSQGSKIERLGQGWIADTQQTDPFDPTSIEITHIFKSDWMLSCDEVMFPVENYNSASSVDYDAEVQFKVDSNPPLIYEGYWQDNWFSSKSYFSLGFPEELVLQMKRGAKLLAAGNANSRGWATVELDLAGFTNAYTQMCE